MVGLEETIGALLLGILLNTFLYGLVTYQYFSYFSHSYGDPLWLKSVVSTLFTLDSVHSASLMYMAWFYTIKHYGQFQFLLVPTWPYPFTVVSTALTAYIVQSFLCYRLLRLTHSYVIYVGGMVLSTAALILGILLGAFTWKLDTLLELPKIRPWLAAWLSMQVVVDAVICGMLIIALVRSKTGFHNSDTVINRMMRMSIQTGVFSGTCSILCLVFFFASPDTQLFGLFGIPISRLYTNTLMDTLICREYLRGLFNQRDTMTDHSFRLRDLHDTTTDIKFDDIGTGYTGSHYPGRSLHHSRIGSHTNTKGALTSATLTTGSVQTDVMEGGQAGTPTTLLLPAVASEESEK